MNTQTNLESHIAIDQLRQYREDKKQSIQTVADHIKVSSDFIRYIESGAFEKLGAPTFIRGHVTNYCKELGIDPQHILSQVPAHLLTVQSFKSADGMASSPLARVRSRSNHLGKYAVGTALLGMLALSFYFVWDKWSVPAGAIDVSDLQLVDSDASSDDATTDKKPKMTYSSLLPQVNMQVQQLPAEVETNESGSESVQPSVTDEASISDDDSAVDEQLNVDDTELQQMAGFSIELEILEEAWVSIKTTDGENVVHDLLEPGVRQFHSAQPVHVRIGNARNTRLMINDANMDLQPFMRRDIADFDWPQNPG